MRDLNVDPNRSGSGGWDGGIDQGGAEDEDEDECEVADTWVMGECWVSYHDLHYTVLGCGCITIP